MLFFLDNLTSLLKNLKSSRQHLNPHVFLRAAAPASRPARVLPQINHLLSALNERGRMKARPPPPDRSSPLGGRVGVQHAAPLHPAPDGVHASQRLLLQAAAASLDALLDPKHEQTFRVCVCVCVYSSALVPLVSLLSAHTPPTLDRLCALVPPGGPPRSGSCALGCGCCVRLRCWSWFLFL